MNEIWKDIIGYEGYYQISNLGSIRSLMRIVVDNKRRRIFKSRILKQVKNTHGYLRVNLSRDSKLKTYYVHQLVATYFIPKSNNNLEINHKDGIKTNNNVLNLEWVTSSENSKHAIENGLYEIVNKKPVVQYNLNHEMINEYLSAMDAQNETGVNRNNISQCCRKVRKTAGGFVWKFKL